MATNCPINKILAIVGSEANTVAGCLIYMLGGIDLPMLARLQEKGIDSYSEAVQELKNINEELYFYTPCHRVTVKDQISSADGLLLVVTPPKASEPYFTTSIVDKLKESAPFFARKKAVILAKSPENQQWSETVYNNLVESLRDSLHNIGIATESILVVPSDLKGENFIEPSSKTPWNTTSTLITALDKILS